MPYRLDIPGQVSEFQLRAIEAVASLVPRRGHVVEVGSLFGRSSWAWAKSVDPSVTVHCIDPWEKNEGVRPMEHKYGITYGVEQFREYVADCENVRALKAYSPRDVQDWQTPVDLYYEDAIHANPGLKANLEFWSSKLTDDGIVCGDDFRPRFPDVRAGAEGLAELFGRELLTVEFFWCLLPTGTPELERVADTLKSLQQEVVAHYKERGPQLRFEVGRMPRAVTVGECFEVAGRVSLESLEPWPADRELEPLTCLLRTQANAGREDSGIVGSQVLDVSRLEPDIPRSFNLLVQTSGAAAQTYDLCLGFCEPNEPSARKDLTSRHGRIELLADTKIPKVAATQASAPNRSGLQPYYVELVPADRNWILERLAIEIQQASLTSEHPFHVDVVDEPSGEADLTYFLPYSKQREVPGSIVGSMFTHQETIPAAHQRFIDAAAEADFAACLARSVCEKVVSYGCDDTELIYLGFDVDNFDCVLRLGVVGRTYHTGRKGETLLAGILGLQNVDVRFTGDGWPLPPVRMAARSLNQFYQSIDYLLIPSLIEGGPVPLFEALASGTPVISSDVGCVADFPHIPFQNGDADDLRRVVLRLRDEKLKLRESVQSLTWSKFGHEHLAMFRDQIEKKAPANRARRSSRTSGDRVLPSVLLCAHGTETKNKGGPTTRMQQTSRAYIDAGGQAQVVYGPHTPARADVTHVYNIWPPESALETVRAAKRRGDIVVFSPIALNLSARPAFSNHVPRLLRYEEPARIDDGLKQLMQLHPEWDGRTLPMEGAHDHFRIMQQCVGLADGVVFLSDREQAFVRRIGAAPLHSTVIRNGIDLSPFRNSEAALFQQKFGLTDFVLCVGRIEDRKNQALVAYALRESAVPLVCIGHVGDPRYFELVRKWAGPNFVHIDRIEDRRLLASAYANARCLALPSWSEGAPLVAIEAACTGTPLLLSLMSGEQEYFGKWAQYVHPADVQAIREAAEQAFQSPQSPAERAERAEACRRAFDIRDHARQAGRFYAEVVRGVRQEAEASARRPVGRVVVDASHLAHQVSNNKPLTGVPGVEAAVIETAHGLNKLGDVVVWNSCHAIFAKTPEGIYRRELLGELGQSRSLPETAAERYLTGYPSKHAKRAVASGLAKGRPSKLAPTLVRAKRIAEKGPAAVSQPLIHFGKRVRSTYQQTRRRLTRLRVRPAEAERPKQGLDIFSGPMSTYAAFPRLSADRLLVLGQPWISNQCQLDDLIGLAAARRLSLEVLIHDVIYVTHPHHFENSDERVARLRQLLGAASVAWVTSERVERDLNYFLQVNGLRCRVRRTKLGIPPGRAVPPQRPNLRYGLQDEFAMYVASFNERKNHAFLVDVWKALAEAAAADKKRFLDLVLVGTPQDGFEHFAESAFQRGLFDQARVHVLTSATDAQLNYLYDHCAFTVFPSLTEGWGIPPIESVSRGKVCLASNTVPSVAETSTTGIIPLDPTSFSDWYGTIHTFWKKPELRQAFEARIEPDSLATGWETIVNDLFADPSSSD